MVKTTSIRIRYEELALVNELKIWDTEKQWHVLQRALALLNKDSFNPKSRNYVKRSLSKD